MVYPIPSPKEQKPIMALDGSVESAQGSFADNPAYQLIFNWTSNPQNINTTGMSPSAAAAILNQSPTKNTNYEFLITKDNNTSYLVAYSADQRDFNTYLPVAQQIMNSFEIINPPAT